MTELIDSPVFGAETDALLKLFADHPAGPDLGPYASLLLDRTELPDPALAGSVDPRTQPRDLEIELPGRTLEARVYHPVHTSRPAPVLLWLHGGGFIGGHLRDIEYATSGIAALGNVVVVSLNYRLAPEDPYPAGLNDVLDTLAWIRSNGSELNGDGRIAVGGQSAGAALAAGACLVARDSDAPLPDHQILCYPCLDVGQDTESYRLFDGTFHSITPGRWSSAQYFPDGELPATAVPLRAESLAGLPPALVLAAGRDPLRDDARQYAERLEGPVRSVEYADTMHAFLNFPAVLSAGRHAVELIGAHLREVFRACLLSPRRSAVGGDLRRALGVGAVIEVARRVAGRPGTGRQPGGELLGVSPLELVEIRAAYVDRRRPMVDAAELGEAAAPGQAQLSRRQLAQLVF